MASAPGPSRHIRSDSLETKDADACYRKVRSLLKNPTEQSIATAEKVFEWAKDQSFFSPLSCSVNTGTPVEKLEELCAELISNAKADLGKPIEERKLARRMSWLD